MKLDIQGKTQTITKSKFSYMNNLFSLLNSWQYNPLSKTIGGFRNKTKSHYEKSLEVHDFTPVLRDSGYTNNHIVCNEKGWTTDKQLHSDQKRTEYRIQYNTKKDIHYKGPMISTGKLKKKEKVYKHT